MKTQSPASVLRSQAGQRVFFDPLKGNHGDTLIHMAANQLLKSSGQVLVANINEADCIVLNGGGSMVDGWDGLDRLKKLSREYPDKPLLVMPSSFFFSQTDPASLFSKRRAPVWLWARERSSFELLCNAGFSDNVQIGIDHDLAFGLKDHPAIEQLSGTTPQDHLLIVERDDWEGPTGRERILSPSGLDFIPEKTRVFVRKNLLGFLRKRQDKHSKFRLAAEQFWAAEMSGHIYSSECADISLSEVCDFNSFLKSIANAKVIITTRLHVAILGHLMNRRVYLVEGKYHKYRGVFDYSLQQGSTALVRWNGEGFDLV